MTDFDVHALTTVQKQRAQAYAVGRHFCADNSEAIAAARWILDVPPAPAYTVDIDRLARELVTVAGMSPVDQKIRMIKLLRTATGCSLVEGRDAVERL